MSVVSVLVSPNGLYLGIERLFDLLGRLLGRGMTWLLLVPIFFLFFLPFGALLRRGRRDRLKRWFDPEADSYWEQHEGPTAGSPERARQY